MRKLTAIAIICLLSFNWYGYRLLLHFLEESNNTALQEKLDKKDYDPNDLLEIRIPCTLPYITDWKVFENYEGETTINGLHYRYVKRKIVNGEVILVCLRNQNIDRLQKAGTDFFKAVNDFPGTEKKSKNPGKIAKANANDYTCSAIVEIVDCRVTYSDNHSIYNSLFTSIKPDTPAQPPNC